VCDYLLHAPLSVAATAINKCPRCGSGVAGGAAFCQVCGQAVEQRRPRPQTGALNVRAMFGDLADAPARGPARQHTEIAPSAGPSPTFTRPGGQSPGRTAAPYLVDEQDAAPLESHRRDTSAPRGRRRPAPRPRPNYSGFDGGAEPGFEADSSAAPAEPAFAAPAPAPARPVSAARGTAPPSASPVYAEHPHRAHPAPRPGAPVDPGASADNLPRPRSRAAANVPLVQAGPRPGAYPGAQAQPSWGSPQPQPQPQPQRAVLRLVLVGRDGQEGESFPLAAHGAEIGRHCAIAFPSDPFVSPQHAKVTPVEGGVEVVDLGSRNGVYLRLSEPTAVYPGDYFLFGNQLLRLDRLESAWHEQPPDSNDVRGFGTPAKPPWAVLVRICVGEIEDDRYHVRGSEITIGREQGEIVFATDGFLSRAHARVCMAVHDNAMTVILEDLDSVNGTYLRIRGPVHVPYGGMFRVGDQIFRVRR